MSRALPAPRIGLLGGTFNPVHVAHLRAAEEVAEALALERVTFVPSAVPPHKRARADDVIADGPSRLAWVRLAVADNPRFDVDPLEVERGGASYTLDTLQSYAARLGKERPAFLLGSDALDEMHTWHRPDEVVALAHVAVMTRPPGPRRPVAERLHASLARAFVFAEDGESGVHRDSGTTIRKVELTGLEVSATDLRERLRDGRSVRYLLPDAVREAVEASGIYRLRDAQRPR